MTRKSLGRFVLAGTPNGLRSLFLLDEMHTGTIPFFHLLYRKNPAAKISDLGKFLLDS
jgi:hypothetical protein